MTDTQLYREAVERMASAAYDLIRMDHDDAIQWELLRKDSYEAVRIRHDAMAMLDALLALLAERGLVVVPAEATDGMMTAGRDDVASELSAPGAIVCGLAYAAMIRAYPNPLKPEEPK